MWPSTAARTSSGRSPRNPRRPDQVNNEVKVMRTLQDIYGGKTKEEILAMIEQEKVCRYCQRKLRNRRARRTHETRMHRLEIT